MSERKNDHLERRQNRVHRHVCRSVRMEYFGSERTDFIKFDMCDSSELCRQNPHLIKIGQQ